MADNAKWYVLHTYSGYENAVKAAIEKSVTNRGLEDMIHKMEIPMETVTEVTEAGVMKEVERKVFPGYVLIKMVLTDDTWHLVRNIRGVTGFVGEANKAIPLTEEEVAALGVEKHEIVVLYHVGDTVKITEGPLASFTGTVEEIEPEKMCIRDRARGVFFTVMPQDSAYLTSILSTPTPPRMMSLSLPVLASSMWLARTLVLERTTTASKSFRAAPS